MANKRGEGVMDSKLVRLILIGIFILFMFMLIKAIAPKITYWLKQTFSFF